MGEFSSYPHCSAFDSDAALGVGCSCAWGSIFMDGLELVALMVLLVGGTGQTFLNSKRFPDIFLPQVMECKHKLACFLLVGGLFSGVLSGKGF